LRSRTAAVRRSPMTAKSRISGVAANEGASFSNQSHLPPPYRPSIFPVGASRDQIVPGKGE
jgi:hypothetical protein